ncbi:hypothetical protein Efla_004667 [Eimeria flavescens]
MGVSVGPAAQGPPKTKTKKQRILEAAAAAAAKSAAAAATAGAAHAAEAQSDQGPLKVKGKRKGASSEGPSCAGGPPATESRHLQDSPTVNGKHRKKRRIQQEQQQEQQQQQRRQQQHEQQQQEDEAASENSAAAAEHVGGRPGEDGLQLNRQQPQRQHQQQQQHKRQQQQQQHLPDWTSRYVVVPAAAADSKASEALLLSLHPAAVAAFRRRIGSSFFPIQLAVIPHVLRLLKLPFGSSEASDVCVHAATGEGKTLCYALPLVSHLFGSVVPRLRCVVLTPTRELALQVTSVFEQLLQEGPPAGGPSKRPLRIVCLAGNTGLVRRQKLDAAHAAHAAAAASEADLLSTHQATADVAVCTPGRFVDLAEVYIHHKQRGTQGTGPSLEALQWLVVDEADKLLKQAYHGWLDTVCLLSSIHLQARRGPLGGPTFQAGGRGPFSEAASPEGELNGLLLHTPPIRKILLSATMTRNPRALHDLQLYKPLFFFCSPTGGAQLPARLQQKYILCKPEEKPLAVCALLYQLANSAAAAASAEGGEGMRLKRGGLRVVVFCGAREAARRLSRLLQLHFNSPSRRLQDFVPPFDEDTTGSSNSDGSSSSSSGINSYPQCVREFSASLSHQERQRLLRKFTCGGVDVLVCSDAAARGLDVRSLQTVIHYQAAANLQTYVHRAGRTARARSEGLSVALLSRDELGAFRHRLEASGVCSSAEIQRHRLPQAAMRNLRASYAELLNELRRLTVAEARGLLSPQATLTGGERTKPQQKQQQQEAQETTDAAAAEKAATKSTL